MFKPNMITMLISLFLGLFCSLFAFLNPIMPIIYFCVFIFMLIFRNHNFWLVIVSMFLNLFIFIIQYSYKYGNDAIHFSQSYVITFMSFSSVMIIIYFILGVIEWKKEN